MSERAAAITIRGGSARVLRAVLGAVFLAVGLYVLTTATAGMTGQDAVIGTGLGVLFALFGCYSLVQAVRTDRLRLRVGDDPQRHDL